MRQWGVREWIANLCSIAIVVGVGSVMWWLIDDKRRANGVIERLSIEKVENLPDLAVVDETGRLLPLHDLMDNTTVVAFVSRGCSVCDRAIPQWKELSAILKNSDPNFIVLSLDPESRAAGYRQEKDLAWPVYYSPHPYVWGQEGIIRVPMTLVVTAGGEVLGKWPGPLSNEEQNEIVDVVATTQAIAVEDAPS